MKVSKIKLFFFFGCLENYVENFLFLTTYNFHREAHNSALVYDMQYGCIRLCRLILQMWICVKLMVSDCLFTYLLYSLHPWYVHAVKHRWHRSNMLIYHIHVITLDCAAICVCSHRFCVLYFAAVCIFRALKSLWFELGKQWFWNQKLGSNLWWLQGMWHFFFKNLLIEFKRASKNRI